MQISVKKDFTQMGIWRYCEYLEPVLSQFRLSLNEGDTETAFFEPLQVWLKREDLNPTGSLKDRGMAYLISCAYSQGHKQFVLSSSGNAAISALALCQKAGLQLKIFVSPNVDKNKLAVLKEQKADVIQDDRPVSSALRFGKENNYYNLRPSINQFGPEGYQTIAFELAEKLGIISDIFIPVSSGVNMFGVYKGFEKLGFIPRFHLCQSSKVHPLAEIFDKDFTEEENSLATALVAKLSPLKNYLINAVKVSKGNGWVIGNSLIDSTQEFLEDNDVSTSNEGALALVAVVKARKAGFKMEKPVVLLTGKKY